MKRSRNIGITLFIAALAIAAMLLYENLNNPTIKAKRLKKLNTLYMYIESGGIVEIRMNPQLAPITTDHVRKLVRKGFFDGLGFNRAIKDYIVQTGDNKGDLTGGSGKMLNSELSNYRMLKGTVAMARFANYNSVDSQFFILLSDAEFLNGQYTVLGKVVSGLDHLNKVKFSDESSEVVSNPTKISAIKVSSDVDRSKLVQFFCNLVGI